MHRRRTFWVIASLFLALAVLFWGVDQGWAQPEVNYQERNFKTKITPAERKAAAARVKALGMKPGVAGMTSDESSGLRPGADSGNINNERLLDNAGGPGEIKKD